MGDEKMKRLFLVVLALIILLVALAFYNNSSPQLIISSLDKRGKIGTGNLVYEVSLFGVVPAARAILKAELPLDYKGQNAYYLNITTDSLKCWSKLFSAEAVLESYVDRQTHNPIFFRQKAMLSNGKNMNKEILYDQKNGIMTISESQRSILPDTQDPLSLMFNIRHMDFDNIKEVEMNINTNQKNYVFKGKAQPRDMRIGNKVYKTVLLDGVIKRRDKNNPYHQTKLSIVLLRDKENIPVLIKVFSSGMLINVKLTDIE
jgi:hypothetical protein